MLVALGSGWSVLAVARKMQFEGVGIQDGGGYTVLLMTAVIVTLAAVAVALS